MPAVNGVGKPCAGEPHARIDGRELETGHGSGHGGGEERPTGNRTVTAAPRLPPILVTAPAPDPPSNVFGQLLSAAGAGKSFEISKWEVQHAWEKVKANKGAAGVDGCSLEEFEADLGNQLYKIWSASSRAGGVAMSSG